jgi:hypothetical protein
MSRVTEISMSAYEEAAESYEGFCIECRAFTTSQCEPDARRYRCEECGKKAVYGAEEALMMGLVAIGEDDEDDGGDY